MQNGSYRVVDHVRYLDAWFEALGVTRDAAPRISWGESARERAPDPRQDPERRRTSGVSSRRRSA